MCEMIFEVQGKTDDYVRLAKDGDGIKFLGKNFTKSNNDELSSYRVTIFPFFKKYYSTYAIMKVLLFK